MTKSMCSKCYREVLASVVVDKTVTITKHCPIHGDETGVLEVDPGFYLESQRHPSMIYPGHLVDVTNKCNLKCKYCFHDNNGREITAAEIYAECAMNTGPYILTGGEPTLRPDLPEIIASCSQLGPTMFLTNGIGLLDKAYLKDCLSRVMVYGGYHGIGLSYHPEMGQFDQVVENIKSFGAKIDSIFFVIDSLDQIDSAIEFGRKNKGLARTIRIKSASNIWNESGASNKIFNSQIINAFEKRGPVIVSNTFKSSYCEFLFDGAMFAAISWHDITNVDLLEINCPPTYRAKTGEVCDFVKAMLINEGMFVLRDR
jgi:hypothetical protein